MPFHPAPTVIVVAIAALGLAACGQDAGHAQKTKGEIKSAAGEITGDKALKREGKKDEVVGGVKSAASDLKGAVKDAKN